MASILLIEDDAQIRQKLAATLADRGHEVTSAPNGMSGVEAALADDVALVVLDLGLPDIDGSDVLQMIRAIKDVPETASVQSLAAPRHRAG